MARLRNAIGQELLLCGGWNGSGEVGSGDLMSLDFKVVIEM